MKKILGWIISGVMFVYGVCMTLAYIGSQTQLEEEQEKRKKIVERHERFRKKIKKEGICTVDDFFKAQDETNKRMHSATNDDNIDDFAEEYWTRDVLFNTLMKVKYPWLKTLNEI